MMMSDEPVSTETENTEETLTAPELDLIIRSLETTAQKYVKDGCTVTHSAQCIFGQLNLLAVKVENMRRKGGRLAVIPF